MFIQFDEYTVIDMNKVMYFREKTLANGNNIVEFRLETRDSDTFVTVNSNLKEVASKIKTCYTMEQEKGKV